MSDFIKDNIEDAVLITKTELKSLVASYMRLNALDCAGVDNWSGYGINFSEEVSDWLEHMGISEEEAEEKELEYFEDIADVFVDKYYSKDKVAINL